MSLQVNEIVSLENLPSGSRVFDPATNTNYVIALSSEPGVFGISNAKITRLNGERRAKITSVTDDGITTLLITLAKEIPFKSSFYIGAKKYCRLVPYPGQQFAPGVVGLDEDLNVIIFHADYVVQPEPAIPEKVWVTAWFTDGSAGFNWFKTQEEADADFAQEQMSSGFLDCDWARFQHDSKNMKNGDDLTRQILCLFNYEFESAKDKILRKPSVKESNT